MGMGLGGIGKLGRLGRPAPSKGGGAAMSAQLLDGLLAWWNMDENNANRADATGNGNTLTDRSTTGRAERGVDQYAAAFSSDYMDADLLTGVTSFSVSFWFYVTASGQKVMFNKTNFPTNTGGFLIQQSSSNKLEIAWWSSGGTSRIVTSVETIAVNTYYHGVATFDAATSTGRLFMNAGTPVSLVGSMGAPPSDLFTVGRFASAAPFYLPGRLDMVGVWNRALSSREVTALYNGGDPAPYPFTALDEPAYTGPYNVIWVIGQSNAVGWATGSALIEGVWSAGAIKQWGRNSPRNGVIVDPYETGASNVPLEFSETLNAIGAHYCGLPMAIARLYHSTVDDSRPVLVVPSAGGSLGFINDYWNPGDTHYEAELVRLNAAMASHPDNELVLIYSGQGEGETTTTEAADAYDVTFDAMLDDIRLRATGAATAPLVAGGMVPGWVGANADRLTVQAAIAAVGTRNRYAAYADPAASPAIGAGTDIHYTPADYRGSDGLGGLALKAVNAIAVAVANTP